jgi:hypothetical protein
MLPSFSLFLFTVLQWLTTTNSNNGVNEPTAMECFRFTMIVLRCVIYLFSPYHSMSVTEHEDTKLIVRTYSKGRRQVGREGKGGGAESRNEKWISSQIISEILTAID